MNAEQHIAEAEGEIINSDAFEDPEVAQLSALQAIAHALVALAQLEWNARYGRQGFGLGGR